MSCDLPGKSTAIRQVKDQGEARSARATVELQTGTHQHRANKDPEPRAEFRAPGPMDRCVEGLGEAA